MWNLYVAGELGLNPEMFNQLRNLQKKARDLKGDIRVLRRSVQTQAHSVRETIKDTFLRFKYEEIKIKI
jgi:TolA-binding protein